MTRHGKSYSISNVPNQYKAGTLVTWLVNNKLPHIGFVIDKKSKDGKRPLIVHNIGGGQVLEDCLFSFKITGHYSY